MGKMTKKRLQIGFYYVILYIHNQYGTVLEEKEEIGMFFSNISIAKKYNYLEDKFLAAYKWLEETDIGALSVGSYPIVGESIGFLIFSPFF